MLLIGMSTALAAQNPTFSSRLEAVGVDVLVTDGRQVIRGLQPADFELRDNGVLQQVDLVSFQQVPLNVLLALDVSVSLAGERLEHLRGAADALLDRLTRDDRAALLTFSQVVALREPLTSDAARLRAALRQVEAHGDTALVDAAHAALVLGDGEAGRSLLLVFSDGLDTSSWLTPEAVLDSAKRSEVVVYGISTRGPEKPRFLEDLAETTGGAVLEAESTRNLSEIFLRILNEFRDRYLVSYSPRGVAKDGWHRIEVRVKGRRATVKARPGYWAN